MRILIATDGSGNAEHAVQLAGFMASLAPSQVHLLGMERPGGASVTPHINQCLQELAKRGVVTTASKKSGEAVSLILELARKQNFELVVLAGSREKGGYITTEKISQLLRSVNSHVLIAGNAKQLPRHILLPLGSSYQSRRAVRYIAPLAKAIGASVDLFHVMEKPPAALQGLENQEDVSRLLRSGSALARSLEWQRRILADTGVRHGMIVQHGDVAEKISAQCERSDTDLVVVGSQPASGSIVGYLLGDVTRKVVTNIDRPILIVRTTEAESGLWNNVRNAVGRLVQSLA